MESSLKLEDSKLVSTSLKKREIGELEMEGGGVDKDVAKEF